MTPEERQDRYVLSESYERANLRCCELLEEVLSLRQALLSAERRGYDRGWAEATEELRRLGHEQAADEIEGVPDNK